MIKVFGSYCYRKSFHFQTYHLPKNYLIIPDIDYINDYI